MGEEVLEYFRTLDASLLYRELRAREHRIGRDPQLESVSDADVRERFSTVLEATCGMTRTFDLFDLPPAAQPLAPLARAVGILVPDVALVSLAAPPLAHYLLNGVHGAIDQTLCSDEPFWSQPVAAQVGGGSNHPDVQRANSGTLFLVTPTIAVTAAHCLSAAADRWRVLFAFEMLDEANPRICFSNSKVYKIDDYVSDPETDVAVIRLNRPVEQAQTLALDPAVQCPETEPLSAIGFPLGLPKKATIDGEAKAVTSDRIIARLGVYGGSSGGPVFNSSREVVGLVSSGPDALRFPFKKDGNCYRLLPCPGPNFDGIEIVRTHVIKAAVDAFS
jgi:S1-C subfamily serine protease